MAILSVDSKIVTEFFNCYASLVVFLIQAVAQKASARKGRSLVMLIIWKHRVLNNFCHASFFTDSILSIFYLIQLIEQEVYSQLNSTYEKYKA